MCSPASVRTIVLVLTFLVSFPADAETALRVLDLTVSVSEKQMLLSKWLLLDDSDHTLTLPDACSRWMKPSQFYKNCMAVQLRENTKAITPARLRVQQLKSYEMLLEMEHASDVKVQERRTLCLNLEWVHWENNHECFVLDGAVLPIAARSNAVKNLKTSNQELYVESLRLYPEHQESVRGLVNPEAGPRGVQEAYSRGCHMPEVPGLPGDITLSKEFKKGDIRVHFLEMKNPCVLEGDQYGEAVFLIVVSDSGKYDHYHVLAQDYYHNDGQHYWRPGRIRFRKASPGTYTFSADYFIVYPHKPTSEELFREISETDEEFQYPPDDIDRYTQLFEYSTSKGLRVLSKEPAVSRMDANVETSVLFSDMQSIAEH